MRIAQLIANIAGSDVVTRRGHVAWTVRESAWFVYATPQLTARGGTGGGTKGWDRLDDSCNCDSTAVRLLIYYTSPGHGDVSHFRVLSAAAHAQVGA